MKNERVRIEMLKSGLDQKDLAHLLGWTETKLSHALNAVEWADGEQEALIELIRQEVERRAN